MIDERQFPRGRARLNYVSKARRYRGQNRITRVRGERGLSPFTNKGSMGNVLFGRRFARCTIVFARFRPYSNTRSDADDSGVRVFTGRTGNEFEKNVLRVCVRERFSAGPECVPCVFFSLMIVRLIPARNRGDVPVKRIERANYCRYIGGGRPVANWNRKTLIFARRTSRDIYFGASRVIIPCEPRRRR